jgi:P-aminobenzoate N-oxygenase AurF
MATTSAVPATTEERHATAKRLLRSSARTSYDPLVHIDWDAPLEPGRFYLPAHRSSLYGTHLWERLDHDQRVELTKHEVASIASIGIWFETILMQMLVRHSYDRDPTAADIQYAYTEVGDETRHSVMFARMIDALGTGYYRPRRLAHRLGAGFAASSNGPMTFGGALFVEEVTDQLQRETVTDEDLQPLVRAVSRVHVVEEARHMAYARVENRAAWAALGPAAKAWTKLVLAIVAWLSSANLVHPRVYGAVGLDPKEARRVAENNPHWRETRKWAARKAVATFEEAGMLAGPVRWVWRRAGLV